MSISLDEVVAEVSALPNNGGWIIRSHTNSEGVTECRADVFQLYTSAGLPMVRTAGSFPCVLNLYSHLGAAECLRRALSVVQRAL